MCLYVRTPLTICRVCVCLCAVSTRFGACTSLCVCLLKPASYETLLCLSPLAQTDRVADAPLTLGERHRTPRQLCYLVVYAIFDFFPSMTPSTHVATKVLEPVLGRIANWCVRRPRRYPPPPPYIDYRITGRPPTSV